MQLTGKRLMLGSASHDFREIAKTMRPRVATQKARYRMDWLRFVRGVEVTPYPNLVRLGSDYGGWTVPADLIRPDWICYSGGVGRDISFDLELIQRFGCEVWAFDPIPAAAAYAEREGSVDGFHFLPYGIWSEDTEQKFYAPLDHEHVSHSIDNLQHTNRYVLAQCRSLPSLMAELGHARVDLLKLDIEGAEYAALEAVVRGRVVPRVLCVEFHRLSSVNQMLEAVDRLMSAGWTPVYLNRSDMTLLRHETRCDNESKE